jgi:uncharacterized protein (TIGR01244 family)
MSLLVVALLLAGGDPPAAADPAVIPNYSLFRPGLAVAGKPSPSGLAKLKEMGFKTVIDLRMPAEGLDEEKASVEGQGLRYVSVPMTSASFSLADALKVKGVIEAAGSGPVLLHCASANRVGGVVAVIEGLSGKSVEQAIEDGKRAGLKSDPMIEAVKRVLAEPAAKP